MHGIRGGHKLSESHLVSKSVVRKGTCYLNRVCGCTQVYQYQHAASGEDDMAYEHENAAVASLHIVSYHV